MKIRICVAVIALVVGLSSCKEKQPAQVAPTIDKANVEQAWEHFMDEIERTPFDMRGQRMTSIASQNIDNELGYRILTTIEFDSTLHLRLLKQMPDSFQQRKEAKELIMKLQGESKARINNFNMDTLEGDWIQLYAELKKHRVTILDFWASWCKPCRQEMPQMVKLYADFKDKGLGIVGISLDTEHNAWKQAVEELGMTWTQMSDLKGWDNLAAKSNGITSIPHTIVVDAEGNVLNEGLKAPQLREFIESELKG